MAKQATTKNTTTDNVIDVPQKEETINVIPVKKEVKPSKPQWEIKDRTYLLKGAHQPITYTIQSKHSQRWPMLWFNNETGEQQELRYATNQNSPFVSEQKGEVTLGHIMFKNGSLFVSKEKQNLQKLLSLYHPKKGVLYYEYDQVEVAEDDLEDLLTEVDALNAAMGMEIDQMEAILRVEVGSKVADLTSKEIKRDLLLFAKKNPNLFLNLANDENVELRNFAIKASEANIIYLSSDQRSIHWSSNDKRLMIVPFDENPFSAFASYLKTDEGVEVYKSIEKKLY